MLTVLCQRCLEIIHRTDATQAPLRLNRFILACACMINKVATGKLVIITGASRGLGRAMALEFARLGHVVAGCARTEKAAASAQSVLGAPHQVSAVDVANDAQVSAWAAAVIAKHGAPDLLLNNAAIINPNAPLWKVSRSDFDAVVVINIKGVANVIRHFLPAMVHRRSGVIVNFSSGWGRSASPEVAPYCASKWAVEGLTQALALELPAGMAAVPLNPGIINTDMLRSCFGGSAADFPDATQWAKKAVPFLLSLDSRQNGQPISVP